MDAWSPPAGVAMPRFVGGRQVVMEQRELAAPGPGQLLLEVRANAVCGTDRGLWERGWPVTPGHESAGTVVAGGPGTSVPVGTLGVVYLMDFCGRCRACRIGATNQCHAKRADMGFTHDGGYGPFELVHETNFFPIDPDMDPGEATLLLDVMGTTGHAIDRARLVRPDIRSAIVAGAGPIGLGLVVLLRLTLGPDVAVFISDNDPARLALARVLGARTIDVRETTLAAGIRAAGLEHGADVAFDAAGRASARGDLLRALGRRGVLVCIAHGERLDLDVSADLIATERSVLGSEYFRFDRLPLSLELLRRHRRDLAPIITHRYPRTHLAEALETFFAGGTGKVIVDA